MDFSPDVLGLAAGPSFHSISFFALSGTSSIVLRVQSSEGGLFLQVPPGSPDRNKERRKHCEFAHKANAAGRAEAVPGRVALLKAEMHPPSRVCTGISFRRQANFVGFSGRRETRRKPPGKEGAMPQANERNAPQEGKPSVWIQNYLINGIGIRLQRVRNTKKGRRDLSK